MEIKIRELIATRQEIRELEELKPAPPIGLYVKLARNLRQLRSVLDDYDKAYSELVKEYGVRKGDRWQVEPEDTKAMEAFANAHMGAMDVPVDVSIHPIPVSDVVEAMDAKPGFEVPMRAMVRMTYLFDLEEGADHDETPDKEGLAKESEAD